jgi:hypothetical protein
MGPASSRDVKSAMSAFERLLPGQIPDGER